MNELIVLRYLRLRVRVLRVTLGLGFVRVLRVRVR